MKNKHTKKLLKDDLCGEYYGRQVRERCRALRSRKATERLLLSAMHDPDDDIRYAAARNVNATEKVLLLAVEDNEPDIRYAAAMHRKATEKVLKIAVKDQFDFVEIAALKNRNVTPRILINVFKRDWYFNCNRSLREVAKNPKVRKLNLSFNRWVELVAKGIFNRCMNNVPSHVRKNPRFKSAVLLNKLAK